MADVYMSAAYEGNSYIGGSQNFGDDGEDAPNKSERSGESDGDDENEDDDDDGDREQMNDSDSESDAVQCPFCSEEFTCPVDDLARHVSVCHPKACLRCKKVMSSDDEYEAHVLEHEASFACNLCDEQFYDEAEFEFHRMSDHGAQRCKDCSAVLVESETEIHQRRCRGGIRKMPFRVEKANPLKITRRGGVLGITRKRKTLNPPASPESRTVTRGMRKTVTDIRKRKGELEKNRRDTLVAEFKNLVNELPALQAIQHRHATKLDILYEAVHQIKRLEEQSHTYHKVKRLLVIKKQKLEEQQELLKKTI